MQRVRMFCGCDITPDVKARTEMQELLGTFRAWYQGMKPKLDAGQAYTLPDRNVSVNKDGAIDYLRCCYNQVCAPYNAQCRQPVGLLGGTSEFSALVDTCHQTITAINVFFEKNPNVAKDPRYVDALTALSAAFRAWSTKMEQYEKGEYTASPLTHTH